jgi:regulator of protease activity HflC (stomatin/prohibitin superfamily)
MLFLLTLVAAVLAGLAWRTVRRLNPAAGMAAGAVCAALVLIALAQTVRVVPAGHVGVVDLFGRVDHSTRKSGLNVVNPFARLIAMSVKTQELKEVMDVPSREGLTMQLEASVLFHLDPEQAAEVYKSVGPDYVSILLEPQFRSVTRGVTSQYEARALYTSEREQLAQAITGELKKLVEPRGVQVESTPLRKMTLPARLAAAIEEKLGAEQESQRMQFVLAREKQEADRRRIEAQGIADFQRIVSQGINEQLLKWKGIEATQKIAESQNTKVVIVGAGKDGLPVILGGN